MSTIENDPQFDDLPASALARLIRADPSANGSKLEECARQQTIADLLRLRHAEQAERLARVAGSATIGPRDTPAGRRTETADAHLPKTGDAARFAQLERAEFPHGQRRTADSLIATLATRAGMLVMPEKEREATLSRIRAFLANRPETADGEFTLPMLTCVLRVRLM